MCSGLGGWTSRCATQDGLRTGEHEKLFEHIILRRSDSNVPSAGLCALLKTLGFDKRIKSDHYIFVMSAIEEILNPQPKGRLACA